MNKTKTGFTLFELLVSISIIGILTALGVLSFSSAQTKARDARRMEDMTTIQKAVEQLYVSAGSTYPASVGPWVGYLENWPVDPKNSGLFVYTPTFSTSSYCVCANLEGNKGNSNVTTCLTFVATGTGDYYCVKNQQ